MINRVCRCSHRRAFGDAMTETETRRLARQHGWKVGRNRDDPDFCPDHAAMLTGAR